MQEERTTQETYEDDVMPLEYCHNLIAQVHPNPVDNVEYATLHAMLIARVMNELSSKITRQGASFAQQHLLHKGLKVFGKKGHEASAKEINQLYWRNCFSPISVASMTTGERRKVMMALIVEKISLSSLWQSLKITVATLTNPHVILHWLWCA